MEAETEGGRRLLLQRTARVLQWLTVGCIAAAGAFLVAEMARLAADLFLVIAGAGGLLLAPILIVWMAPRFLWQSNAPLVELFGVLIVSLTVMHLLRRKGFHASAIAIAVAVFVGAVPFVRAEVFFLETGARLPLLALGADALSYRTLSTDPHIESRYGLDRHACSGQVLPGANPKTFALVPGVSIALALYAKDDQHAWWNCEEIPNADPTSIRVVNRDERVREGSFFSFAMDTHAVYFQGKVIPNADPSTYQLLPSLYAKDKEHVWSGSHILSNADSTTFQVLVVDSRCYLRENPNCPPDAKDGRQSYLHGQIIGSVK